MVVMNGLATTTGSSFIIFAMSGSEQPTIFATNIVVIRDRLTVKDIKTVYPLPNNKPSIKYNLPKQAIAKVIETKKATLISLNIT